MYSLTQPCIHSTDELFKASAYFTDALLSFPETTSKRTPFAGLFSRSSSTEPPIPSMTTPTTSTTLLPPISLTSGPRSPSTQGVSKSPLARAQPVIRRLLSRPKLSGSTDDRLFSFPVSPPGVPTLDTGPILAPTAFNLSQRTALSYWTWLETPENSTRLARFARAMAGTEGWMGATDAELCGNLHLLARKCPSLTGINSLSVSRSGRRFTRCGCRWWDRIDDLETCAAVSQIAVHYSGPRAGVQAWRGRATFLLEPHSVILTTAP